MTHKRPDWLVPVLLLGVLSLAAGWFAREMLVPSAVVESAASSDTHGGPDFSLHSLDGDMISLSDFRGRLVLLNFWATWCPPCVEEMPLLMQLQSRHGDGDLQVLGLTMDKPENARPFAERLGINYPLLGDHRSVIAVQDAFGENRLPFTVLIGREGQILWQHAGAITAEMLEQQVQKALQ